MYGGFGGASALPLGLGTELLRKTLWLLIGGGTLVKFGWVGAGGTADLGEGKPNGLSVDSCGTASFLSLLNQDFSFESAPRGLLFPSSVRFAGEEGIVQFEVWDLE